MNKKTLRNNNILLMNMVNGIRGTTDIEKDKVLCPADVLLFFHELKNNKDIIARYDEEAADLLETINFLSRDKGILQNRLKTKSDKLENTEKELKKAQSKLKELEAKEKHNYINAVIKQQVELHKKEKEYYETEYETLRINYRNLFKILENKLEQSNSEDIKEIVVEFAKHTTPKIIIPDVEQKET